MLDVSSYTQRKLKVLHGLFLALFYVVSFAFPIIYSTSVIARKTTVINISWERVSFICVLAVAIVLLLALKALNKTIEKIQILNLDGTYNKAGLITRMILSSVCKALPAIVILCAVCYGGDKLIDSLNIIRDAALEEIPVAVEACKNTIWFYMKFIGHLLGFSIGGTVLEKTILFYLEEEIDIRVKTSEKAAIENRIANLTKIR